MDALELGVRSVSISDVVSVVRNARAVSLPASARRRVEQARAIVDRYAAGSEPVYGLNTGLGGNLGFRLDQHAIDAFQVQLIRGRCVGVGEPLPEIVARAALLCRAMGLSLGGAGITPAVLDLMLAMLNQGVTPVIPGRGSIGAGDLALCASMAAVFIGQGEAWYAGQRLLGAEALARAGLAPVTLRAKDGLSLANASAVTCGHAALTLVEAGDLCLLGAGVAGLACEAYASNPRIFDERVATARPARGQAFAAALFRRLLEGSYLYEPGAARSIQDPLSFRCSAQVQGTLIAALWTAVAAVETEINSVADNPLVLRDSGEILSTGNFHTAAIALAMDTLAIAFGHAASAIAYRTIKLMTGHSSGLPNYLSPVGGASNGFVTLQKTISALHAEIHLKAMPASLDALAVSDGVEDHAPQTPLTIRKLAEQIEPLRMLVAIEAMVAAQAVDLRGKPKLGTGSAAIYQAIRAEVPMLVEDRETGRDADRVLELVISGKLIEALRRSLPELTLAEPAGADAQGG